VGDAADDLVVELEEREIELREFKIVVDFEEAVGVDVGVWDPEEELEDVTPEVDELDAVVEDDDEIVVELEGFALGDM
jgi:hypothetical protein